MVVILPSTFILKQGLAMVTLFPPIYLSLFWKYYLFLIRKNKDIKGLNIFDHLFLNTAYADDRTFLLEIKELIKELVKAFTLFSSFSGLEPNISKCEICGLGSLKGIPMVVCGMQSIDLTRDAIKILGAYFFYNINQNYYCQTITNIHDILKLWRMRSLPIEGKIVVFKTLAIFKLVYLALLTVIPNHITDEVAKIQNSFTSHDSSPKIKHDTLRTEFKAGGLKMLIYVLNLSVFSILGFKNYMMIVFMNGK